MTQTLNIVRTAADPSLTLILNDGMIFYLLLFTYTFIQQSFVIFLNLRILNGNLPFSQVIQRQMIWTDDHE
jgi:hypothetical protein